VKTASSSSPLAIRRLDGDDQQRLWHWLHIALWDPPPAALRPKEVLDAPHVRIYAERWGRAGDIGVVGEIEPGVPVGACWMRVLPDGIGLAFVDRDTPQLGIAVVPEYQHRGYGRALMVAALAAAREQRFLQVSLTVHPQNPAIRMYEQCGFVQRDIRNTYRMMIASLAPSRYTFATYSSAWPAEFAREAARLRQLVGERLVAVHHVGSTSVPGLAAKPVIDLLPLVHDIAELERRTSVLQDAGYRAWGEFGLPGRRYFTKDRDGERTHNLHFYSAADPAVERHLAFCRYLREHAAARDEYEALKRLAHAAHPSDVLAYNGAKTAWIRRIEPIAVDWFRRQRGSDSGGLLETSPGATI
jgi:GrpB-like predicted nucleotidyltransferase (UPF0157 family)/ribosomal protein S18 acetylase RimI-like enzyme